MNHPRMAISGVVLVCTPDARSATTHERTRIMKSTATSIVLTPRKAFSPVSTVLTIR